MALRLGELLVQQGALSQEKLDEMLQRQRAEHRRLGEILVSEGLLEADSLREALAQQSGTTAVSLGDVTPKSEVLAMMPSPSMRRFEVVPLEVEGNTLVVGMVDPQNTVALDAVRNATGFRNISIRVIAASEFAEWSLSQLSGKPELSALLDTPPAHVAVSSPPAEEDEPPIDARPVVTVVDHLLTEAVRRKASGLHIEPFETTARIRMRVDGGLQTLLTVPRRLHRAIVARLSSLAHGGILTASTSEGRGRFRLKIANTVFGQAVTLLSLDVDIHTLDDLDFTHDQRSRLEQILGRPHGLVVIAGPKDSGRTTLASALVEMVSRSERQIVTLSRHGSMGVSGALGFQPHQLDEALSQDPDVLLFDDVPLEDISRMTHAALEGRLVVVTVAGSRAMTTLKTLSSLSSSWSLAATLQAVVAVRLLRRVCPECGVGVDVEASVRTELGLPEIPSPNENFRQGKGCTHCWGTGYAGRVLVSEIAYAPTAMRDAIRNGADEEELMELAREDGFHTLFELAVLAAAMGKTTVSEIRSSCGV